MKLRIFAGLLLLPFLFLLPGCNVVPPAQGDFTRFYLLSSPPQPAAAAPAAPAAPHGLRLGLRSVAVAEYLRSRSMVVRQGANELSLDEYDRWAEPLDTGIARILRTSLVAAPNVDRVLAQPFPLDGDRDFDIAVTVLQCEGVRPESGRVTSRFSALVEIASVGPRHKVVAHLNFVAPDSSWNGHDYAQLAGDLSEAVSGLAREIVAALPAAPRE